MDKTIDDGNLVTQSPPLTAIAEEQPIRMAMDRLDGFGFGFGFEESNDLEASLEY